MTKRRKKKKRKTGSQKPTETKASETVTIAWTLTVMTSILCDLGTAATRFYVRAQPDEVRIGMLSGILFLAAVVIGILSLMMLPVVLQIRRVPPPRAFIVLAVIAAITPLVAIVMQTAR